MRCYTKICQVLKDVEFKIFLSIDAAPLKRSNKVRQRYINLSVFTVTLMAATLYQKLEYKRQSFNHCVTIFPLLRRMYPE